MERILKANLYHEIVPLFHLKTQFLRNIIDEKDLFHELTNLFPQLIAQKQARDEEPTYSNQPSAYLITSPSTSQLFQNLILLVSGKSGIEIFEVIISTHFKLSFLN